jgi:hypothetical protein
MEKEKFSEELIKKLNKLLTLVKALGIKPTTPPKLNSKFMNTPTFTPQVPTVKQPSLTPSSKKDPVKVAEQLKDPSKKEFVMRQAKQQKDSMKNPMTFKSEDPVDNELYDAYINNQRVNSSPAFAKDLKKKYGDKIILKRSKK